MIPRIAVIFPRGTNTNLFDISQFDLEKICDIYFYTSSAGSEKKVNKGEVTLDIESIKQKYNVIMTVDADVTKYITGLSGGIQKFNAYPHSVGDNIFVPVINPQKTAIYPLIAKDVRKAFDVAYKLINGEEVSVAQDKDYLIFESAEELTPYLKMVEEKKVLIFDLETGDLFNVIDRDILGASFGWKDHMGYYAPLNCWSQENIDLLHSYIKNPEIIKVCHHLKFEMKWLYAKWDIDPFDWVNAHDTMAMKYCDDENSAVDLKSLAVQFTDLGPYEDELEKEKTRLAKVYGIKKDELSYAMIPDEILGPYACKDIDATAQIFKKFFFTTKKYSKVYNFLMANSPAIAVLETVGCLINQDRTAETIVEYEGTILQLRKELFEDENVKALMDLQGKEYNPNSVPQTRRLLFEVAKLPVIKTTDKTNPSALASTDAEVLEILADEHGFPIAKKLIDLRKATKFKGTYLENLRDYLASDGRLRTGFNFTRTSSGRLSSSGTINFQNIPRGKIVKQLFYEEEGFGILQMDLATAEVYVAAALSKDQFLIDAFASGLDFHSYVAKKAFNLPCEVGEIKEKYKYERQAAKAITFGILFGARAGKIASEIGCTKKEAQDLIDLYFTNAFRLKEYITEQRSFVTQNGWTKSLMGRTRRVPEIYSPVRGVRDHASNSAFNFLIQSVASDINISAFTAIMKEMKRRKHYIPGNTKQSTWRPNNLVHDSIVAGAKSELVKEFTDIYTLSFQTICKDLFPFMPVPIGLDFEFGPDWGHVENIGKSSQWII